MFARTNTEETTEEESADTEASRLEWLQRILVGDFKT